MDRGTRADVPPSAHFASIVDGSLGVDGASLDALAAGHGTPLHVLSRASIEASYRQIDAALGDGPRLVAYAMKANGNPAVVSLLASLGAGVDAVSGGEIHWALASGVPAERIVMSGVGKSDDEIALALDARIRGLHVESEPELDAIEAIARARGVVARIGLRINPDVDPQTHPYIATGLHDTKFGLEIDVARRLLPRIVASESLALETVACHIGSQLPRASSLADAVEIAARFARECLAAGARIESIDAGGGWPITYGDEDASADAHRAFGAAIREGMRRAELGELSIVVEPGRALVGDAGALLTRVVFVKEQAGKRFVVVDAAMTELLRPALYGAYHAIVPVRPRPGPSAPCDVVGPVCETGDFLALGRALPEVRRGDLLLIRGTGAYGASMSTEYNARPRAAEVLVESGGARVIRPRGRIEDLHVRG